MQVSSKKYRLGDILLKQGVITEEQLMQVIAYVKSLTPVEGTGK